jgi:hypothetical protein
MTTSFFLMVKSEMYRFYLCVGDALLVSRFPSCRSVRPAPAFVGVNRHSFFRSADILSVPSGILPEGFFCFCITLLRKAK